MNKLIPIITALLLLCILGFAAFGVFYNSDAKVSDMPVDIKYEIKTTKNIWPDHYYSLDYPTVGDKTFHLDSYWTFEHSSYFLGGPVWVFHPYEINMTDVDFSVIDLPR